MFVCMFVCMIVCMFVCMFVCIIVCMCVCMFVCMFVCMSVCMFVCISVCGVYCTITWSTACERELVLLTDVGSVVLRLLPALNMSITSSVERASTCELYIMCIHTTQTTDLRRVGRDKEEWAGIRKSGPG